MERFELHVTDADVTGGTISVGWCVPKETLAKLNELGVKDPQVVITVAPDNSEIYHCRKEYRKVVPLRDLIAYVEFRCSGKNKIWGFISTRNPKDATDRYLSKSRGEYVSNVLDSRGQDWSYSLKSDEPETNSRYADPVSVAVPAACFAPEPSDWEKTWVTWLQKEKAIDQCEFRRKRLFAYTLQIPVFLFAMSCYLVATAVAALIGARSLSLKPLLQPFAHGPSDIIDMFRDGSIFIRPDQDTWVKRWCLFPFMPAALLVLAALAFMIVKCHMVYGLLTLLIVGGALVLFVSLGAFLINRLVQYKLAKKLEEENAAAWYLDEAEAQLMYCAPGKRMTRLSDLPKQKRTLRLRFLDLKAKVCRPFSA